MALIFALISGGRVIFAAPGAVYISPSPFNYAVTKKRSGVIALSGPLTNVIIALVFLLFSRFGGVIGALGLLGFEVNLWLAAFNLILIPPIDGKKIFDWNPVIWALIAIPTWILLFIPLHL